MFEIAGAENHDPVYVITETEVNLAARKKLLFEHADWNG